MFLLAGVTGGPVRALSIQIDYRFDDYGFFADESRRQAVEDAARDLSSHFGDSLTAVASDGGNGWTARFTNPSTGAAEALPDLVVPADTLVVFAGARGLRPTSLGLAAPGTASVTGSRAWFETVSYRGQLGAAATPATDFGPWGGFVSFDLDTNWFSDITLDGLGPEEVDLYSVALHELAHVMGFGLAESWLDQVSLGRFVGASAVGEYGAPVPLSAERKHWAEDLLNIGNGQIQKPLMTPFLPFGNRTLLTELDQAGIADVGWVLAPEPGTFLLLLVPLLAALCRITHA